jgi:hypothetical protein
LGRGISHIVAHKPATSIPEYGYRFKGAAPTRFWCGFNYYLEVLMCNNMEKILADIRKDASLGFTLSGSPFTGLNQIIPVVKGYCVKSRFNGVPRESASAIEKL